MLADTDRQASINLNGTFAARTPRDPTDMLWNVEFAYPAGDLPPSAYTFNTLGTVCKTMCCGGKNAAFKKGWKFPKNMSEFQQFGADWM